MTKLLSALISLVIAVIVVAFALSNKQPAVISLWPFDVTATMPTSVLALGCFGAGLLMGGLFIWLAHVPHRWRSRRLDKNNDWLTEKVVALEAELELYKPKPAAVPPVPLWQFWKKS